MAYLFSRDNDALEVNPPAGHQHLTTNGSNWLWAVTAVFVLTFLAIYALTFRARAGERFFHYVFTIASLVGAIAYFAMASDLGWSVVAQAHHHERGVTRQIFFAKYIYWVVSFPAAILALGVLSGVSWATILFNILLSWIWIISYLVGAYTVTEYKWGFFAFGTVAWLLLAISTLHFGRQSAVRVGASRDYLGLTGWLNLLWLMYPIAWGLTEGGNRIGVVGAHVWFGILDILMIPIIGFAIVALSRRWDYNRLNIAFTQYGRVPTHGTHFHDKTPGHHTTPATTAV